MKILFWNVDTQQDFMLKGGKLYVEDAETIIPVLKKLTDFARDNNIQVVSTADCHTKDSKEISDNPDFINTFPEHCIAGTVGATFIYETSLRLDNLVLYDGGGLCNHNKTITGNIVILKDAFDVFAGNKHTEEIVKRINPDVVIVYGVASDICVNFAVLGLAKRGYKVIIVGDAIKELPTANMLQIITKWTNCGAYVMNTTDEVIKYVKEQL